MREKIRFVLTLQASFVCHRLFLMSLQFLKHYLITLHYIRLHYENPTAITSAVVVSTRHKTTSHSSTSYMHQHQHNCHY